MQTLEDINIFMELSEKERFEENFIRAELGEYVPNETKDKDLENYDSVERLIKREELYSDNTSSSEETESMDTIEIDYEDEELETDPSDYHANFNSGLRHAIHYHDWEREQDEANERQELLEEIKEAFMMELRWIYRAPYENIFDYDERERNLALMLYYGSEFEERNKIPMLWAYYYRSFS